jgi:hypothetical protein
MGKSVIYFILEQNIHEWKMGLRDSVMIVGIDQKS